MTDSFNWDSLIWDINNNNIIPVLGGDLSVIKLPASDFTSSESAIKFAKIGISDGEDLRFNLYQYLAFKLWDIRGSGEGPPVLTLNNVVQQLQAQKVAENQINKVIKDVVANLTDTQIVLEPFKKLARIGGFDTILSVNIDNFLERAFSAEAKHLNPPINYSIPENSIVQGQDYNKALPQVFNLMGNIKGSNYALSEEQFLEYLLMLQNGAESTAKNLFDSIEDKSILLIGCSFPNWFMRFFIRIIAKERFKDGKRHKYVACDHTSRDEELYYFLKNNATQIIKIDTDTLEKDNEEASYNSSIEFIDGLYEKWAEKTNVVRNQIQYKERLFLSYARDDQSIVEKLRSEFERNGVSVFFDRDTLKQGAAFSDVIKRHIKDCDYFLPIISDSAISNSSRYVYAKEWTSAIILNGYMDDPYLRPYIIDNTSPTDDRIPEEIRSLDIRMITNPEDFGDVVRTFIKENKFTAIDA